MKFDLLICIQAPADLRYALDIFSKERGAGKVHFAVINVFSVYDFIKSLNLENCHISYHAVPYVSLFKPWSFFKAKKKMAEDFEFAFGNNCYSRVYFFSRFFDWYTAGILVRLLVKNCEVTYFDHYDDISLKNDKPLQLFSANFLKYKLRSTALSYVSSAKVVARYSVKNIEFAYWKYKIKVGKIPECNVLVNDAYLYQPINNHNNVALFLLSPDETDLINCGFRNDIINQLIQHCRKQGYRVGLKGHPRLGTPKSLEGMFDFQVPNTIPSEFICYKTISYVIGLFSASLKYALELPNVSVVSLIKVAEFKEEELKPYYESYLSGLGLQEVHLPETFDDCKLLIV